MTWCGSVMITLSMFSKGHHVAYHAPPRMIYPRYSLPSWMHSRSTTSIAGGIQCGDVCNRRSSSGWLPGRSPGRPTEPTGDTLDAPRATRLTTRRLAAQMTNVVVLAPTVEVHGSGERWSDLLARSSRVAKELGADLVTDDSAREALDHGCFTVFYDHEERLALGQPGSGFSPLVVDFCSGKIAHRTKTQQGTEQVVKAVALPKRRGPLSPSSAGDREGRGGGGGGGSEDDVPLQLWDLTAGLGTDAFVLACAGWSVRMFERSPIVAALVQDALDRARAGTDEVARVAASRMTLVVADSTKLRVDSSSGATRRDEHGTRPAVVYLDPMFPRRKKSALVKKGMQMLQMLLEEGGDRGDVVVKDDDNDDDEDEDESVGRVTASGERTLFDAAMSLATRKVVVKRPIKGPAIVDHVTPSHAVVSKNGRFDVYTVT